MRLKVLSGFIVFSLLFFSLPSLGQSKQGDISINFGVGYSPAFNGSIDLFGSEFYPAETVKGVNWYDYSHFWCTSIVPDLGLTGDYNLLSWYSLGLAIGYQNENVNWLTWSTSNNPPYWTDKVTRVNLAARMLFHLTKNSKHFDFYLGIRPGCCYWNDKPLNDLLVEGPTHVDSVKRYSNFLARNNYFSVCFQTLMGLRVYANEHFGAHFEFGIGQPFLAEAGLTFRFNTSKESNIQSSDNSQPAK